MKTIVVTGSAGFIGFALAKKLLAEGYNVIGIDEINSYYDVQLKKARNDELLKSSNYGFYQLDIADNKKLEDILSKTTVDTICHMAGQAGVRYSLEKPFIYEHANVRGFLSVLETAKKQGIQNIIFASSSSVYGNVQMPNDGFSETQSVDNPISLYAATKRADELIAYTYHHLFGLKCTGLRFFTVYGPWGRPDMSYFLFTKAILAGKPISVYNHGEMKRDFTYIDDVVDGITSAISKSLEYEIINIGNSSSVKLLDFIATLERHLGRKAIIDYKPLQAGDVINTYANTSKAEELLAYHPAINIDEGLANFVSWYKDFYHVKPK